MISPRSRPDLFPIPQGFSDWKRADFNAFVRGCELFGRNDLASVTSEVEGKTEKEVAKYASTFFARYKEIKDWEKVLVTCVLCRCIMIVVEAAPSVHPLVSSSLVGDA